MSGVQNFVSFKIQPTGGYTSLYLISPNALSASAWHHVAATVAPAGGTNYDMKLYIDGTMVAYAVRSYSSSWPSSGTPPLCFGQVYAQNYSNLTYSLDGKQDEVRIYNRALTPAVIGRLAGK